MPFWTILIPVSGAVCTKGGPLHWAARGGRPLTSAGMLAIASSPLTGEEKSEGEGQLGPPACTFPALGGGITLRASNKTLELEMWHSRPRL
jgi:hypothetical protein